MPWFLFTILGLASVLFIIKVIYILSTTAALPVTQGALFVSTTKKRIEAFLDQVPMEKGGLLTDLGCGDGRVLRMAARRYGVNAVGYELNPMAYIKARMYSLFSRGVHIRFANFYEADISKADVVFCYLFPDVMQKISDKVKSELKPGAVFVSCNFPLPGLAAEKTIRPRGSLHSDPIYIYKTAALQEKNHGPDG